MVGQQHVNADDVDGEAGSHGVAALITSGFAHPAMILQQGFGTFLGELFKSGRVGLQQCKGMIDFSGSGIAAQITGWLGFDQSKHGGIVEPLRILAAFTSESDSPNCGGKLLFEDLPQYRYSIYVTNLPLPLDQIWNVYNSRADCENRIKELKADFGLDCFCMKGFWATEASFRFIMLAYNLLALFRHVALNERNGATLKTLRS